MTYIKTTKRRANETGSLQAGKLEFRLRKVGVSLAFRLRAEKRRKWGKTVIRIDYEFSLQYLTKIIGKCLVESEKSRTFAIANRGDEKRAFRPPLTPPDSGVECGRRRPDVVRCKRI